MKQVFDPQLQKYHNRVEAGDVIKVIVDDETAKRIKAEEAATTQAQYEEAEKLAEAVNNYLPLHTGLNAPREWHEANFVLGKDILWPKEINTKKLQEDKATGEMEEVKVAAGFRGAVANYKRVKPQPDLPDVQFTDDYSFFDWQIENGYIEVEEEYDFNDAKKNLLDFYVLPSFNRKEETSIGFVELDDPPLPFKPSVQTTWGIADHRDYIAKVALRMRKDNLDYGKIRRFIEEAKVARNCS